MSKVEKIYNYKYAQAYIIKNATLLTGQLTKTGRMIPKKDMAVVVRDGAIIDICKTESLADYKLESKFQNIIDLQGKYLLPGLINAHLHLAGKGGPEKKKSKPTNYKLLYNLLTKVPGLKTVYTNMEKDRALAQLKSGVTTARSVGGILNFDSTVRNNINKQKWIGPRILTCDAAISVPGGHFAGSLAIEAKSAAQARRIVRDQAKQGSDFIKVMITGGVMDGTEPGLVRMEPEIIKAITEEAKRLNIKTLAHVESSEGVEVALKYGIDSIEHGASMTKSLIEKAKAQGTVFTATLSPVIPYAFFDEDVSHCGDLARKNAKIVFTGMKKCYKQCIDNDIPLGAGTDTGCPFITHYNMWRELHYLTTFCDLSPSLVLYIATLGNALNLDIANETGSIEIGKCPDMIVCSQNPLDNFRALSQLDYVFTEHTIIKNPIVKKDPHCDIPLDKHM